MRQQYQRPQLWRLSGCHPLSQRQPDDDKCVNKKIILNCLLTLMTPLLNTWVATVSPPAVSVSPHMIPFFIFVYFLYLLLIFFVYLGKQNRATNPVSQEHLGQGLLVSQQPGEHIRGDLRHGDHEGPCHRAYGCTLAKTSLLGTKMVMALAPLTVSTRPASVTAVTRVENLERCGLTSSSCKD